MGTALPFLSTALFALLLVVSTGKGESEYDVFLEFSAGEERGLFPNIFNLATNALIWADSTCGARPETYCKLLDHVYNRAPQCDECDQSSSLKRHPIEYAIDGTSRWWQSPSLANGLQFEKVNITIDLRQEYQVAYIIVKSAIAPRPATWVLEKSLDGVNYEPWQYYASSDSECMRVFSVPATVGVPRFTKDDEVICTSYYSRLDPFEHGEIHTSLINGRPTAEAASETLQKFTRARFVRLRLLSLRTLNADIFIVNHIGSNPRLDTSVTRRYFYAIKDISIGGQCICHGHAETCPPDPVTGQFKCECRHNTCGESCNKCCPLYNQLPWKPGTQSHPNVCQACQCFNHADSCEYDEKIEKLGLSVTPEGIFEGGGRCINCKHNTDGINCERCKWTYYRPSGVTHYREDACRPCDCDPVGSEHGNCVRDETSAVNGQKPGDCICKPGFGGRRCDRCAVGYRNHPRCDPCPCNQAGSLNFDTCEEEKCVCKPNVEGLYCDRCKPGTINLNVKDPQGCQPCFCFGLGKECAEKEWTKTIIRNNHGWLLTDLQGQIAIKPKTENEELLMFNSNDHKDTRLYYWKAPAAFLGNLLNSYGGSLQYYVYFVPNDHGRSVPIADVVIEGNGMKLEYYSRQDFFPRENISVQIPMKESQGWYNSRMRVPVEKADMMRALTDVKHFLVRAMYHENQVQSSVYGLALDTAVDEPKSLNETDDEETAVKKKTNGEVTMRGVEVCECPENYAGNSCERCAPGYRRVNNQLYGGKCEKCNCEGHSDECDPFNGNCLKCKHNTTGDRCEQCLPGHYGNPSLGGELGQCKPCACPTLANNHSPQCTLTELVVGEAAAVDEDAFVCTACENGYDGNKCEICADGFFGDPMAVNGSCQPCSCSGNIDPMAIGNCDSVSGECLKCIYNTAGKNCEECKENHWGTAGDKTCTPCLCHPKGAVSPKCNIENGDCECHENYEGKQCDKCKDGHGDIENMCPACNCNSVGAVGTECDQVSGQCTCKTGVFGKQCDMCRSGYFNFTENGCQFCHCDPAGAIDDGRCDNTTGKCECQANVDGNMCEKCVDGFFNISSGVGCQECKCDAKGSEGIQCDIRTGQCACKPGVTGAKCDTCAPNHYGLDESGCKECKVCPAPGQVCDPVTGDCVCPPNTVGEMCENCTANAWDYDPLKGCKLCDCSEIGADGPDCNPLDGQCQCRRGFVGLKCDRCTHGHFNFPKCEPCNCDVSGTSPKACGVEGACLCDESGQCPCKKNVKGLKCDQCEASSFSLDKTNPLGCTECFCFNRTDFCVQSSLVWQQIYAQDREVTFTEPWNYFTRRHNLNILKEFPLVYNSYPSGDEPLYWPLPRSFLADRIASYNGFLRFKVSNDDNRRGINGVQPDPRFFKYYPQVVLVANHRIILEHVPNDLSESGRYKVRLHENHWRSRLSPDLKVTRKQMMIALQNLQGIYVRATYNHPSRGDSASLKDVSLDIAVWENTTESAENTAIGVEMCECPREYSGSSCQDPAEGYCRRKTPDYLNSEDDLVLIGIPEPCACNGHSTTCDPETCQCTNCEHNTVGDFCQYCKPGYHGDALVGGSDACIKCACPLADNSFSATCVPVAHGRGYKCDSCKPGYTGMYCESCVSGYFGDPNTPNGNCTECRCHPNGSKHGVCDPVSGQCECHPGVTGRDCSLCQERHAFMEGVCTSCDQGCTKELMIMVDELEEALAQQNFSNLRPIPWKRMARISNNTKALKSVVGSLNFAEGKSIVIKDIPAANAKNITTRTFESAKHEEERINKSYNAIIAMINKVIGMEDKVQQLDADSFDDVQQLKHFVKHGGTKHDNSAVDSWIAEAETYLVATKDRGDYIEKQYLRGASDYAAAQKLLETITERKFNYGLFEELKNRSNQLDSAISDYRNAIWEKAGQDTDATKKVSDVVSKRIGHFNDFVADIKEDIATTEDELTTAKNFVAKTKSESLLSIFDDYQHVKESLTPAVRENLLKCRSEADKYSQLLDEYRHEYDVGSEEYAKKLEQEAENLKNSFAATKLAAENPIQASNSYKEIVEALKNASAAAENAKKAAKDAYAEADIDSDKSMVKMASKSRDDSLELQKEAENLSLDEIEDTKNQYRRRIDALMKAIEKRKGDKMKKEGDFQEHDKQHDRLSEVLAVSKDAEAKAAKLSQQAKALKNSMDDIAPQVGQIHGSTKESIGTATSDVRKAKAEIESAKETISEIRNLLDEEAKRNGDLRSQLTLLKEKIREAREKAAKVRTSLKSDDSAMCKRSFMSPIQPSPSNKISVKYRPANQAPNALLFLTRTTPKRVQNESEYIAIELRDRRIVVHWDIGGGAKRVTNTHAINEIPMDERYVWYQIDLDRQGDIMSVTVSRKCAKVPECASDQPITVTFGDNKEGRHTLLNSFVGETRVQIGCDEAVAKAIGLSTNKFHGTIGEIMIDGEPLALWSFTETTTECKGAFAVPADSSSGHMFREGYAQIDLHLSDKYSYRLHVQFSAYSPDGLIYFRGDPLQGDFVALELRDGRIIFKMNLGDESYASVQSEKATYNDGRTHNVVAMRKSMGMEITLLVDGTDQSTRSIPGSSTVLDIDTKEHFVGGVPSNFTVDAFSRFDIHWDGFFGCIQKVAPSSMTELDLDHPVRSHRKSAGCAFKDGRLKPTDKIIGFAEPGYLVTQGIRLEENCTFGFNVRSRQSNAVLVFQSSSLPTYKKREKRTDEENPGEGYISFYLMYGRLVLHIGTDSSVRKNVLTMVSSNRYNDGNLHSIFLSRTGRNVRLSIDDTDNLNGNLPDNKVIGTATSQMYFGGFPEGVKPLDAEIPTDDNLIGCISEIFYNYKRFPIIPEAHLANIGSCPVEDIFPVIPTEEPKDQAFLARHSKLRLEMTEPTFATSEHYYHKDDLGMWPTRQSIEEKPSVGPSGEVPSSEATVESKESGNDEGVKECTGKLADSDGINAALFGLTETGLGKLKFTEYHPNSALFDLSFDFRTKQEDGILWAWLHQRIFSRSFYLKLVEGLLILEAHGTKGLATLKYDSLALNDEQWHHVDMKKQNQEVMLRVDSYSAQYMKKAPNPVLARKRMYVGNVPTKVRKNASVSDPQFVGCVRNFYFDEKPMDLFAGSKDLVMCGTPSKSTYVHNGGFLTFEAKKPRDSKNEVRLRVRFRPAIDSGLIFGLMTSKDPETTRLTLSIEDGKVLLEIALKEWDHPKRYTVHRALCDGKWHDAAIHISASEVSFAIDNVKEQLQDYAISAASLRLLRNLPINIGGVSATTAKKINASSLVGCFNELFIDDKEVPMKDAKRVSKAAHNQCPYQEQE